MDDASRVGPGADNLGRLRRRLARHPAALAALRSLGIGPSLVERHALALKEPYRSRITGLLVEDALAFPVPARAGGSTGRYAYLPLEGVTLNPIHPAGWGPGDALPYFSGPAGGDEELVVVSDPVTMWLMAEALRDADRRVVVVTRSHPGGVPFGWTTDAFWEGWSRVVLALDRDDRSTGLAAAVRAAAGRELREAATPDGETWADLVRAGASQDELRSILDRARVSEHPVEDVSIGDEVDPRPVAAMGAWVKGRMYYPLRVERTERRSGDGGVLTRYAVLVLRSDGEMLEARELPAPPGTPRHARVCALGDGTRIDGLPFAGPASSWSPGSIRAFVEARRAGADPSRRPLPRILADVDLYLRSTVWLPDDDAYALVTLFVAVTHCHRLFPALPILFVNGAHGTGKSEVGQACADLGFNGMVAGHVTAAALVRLSQESRGLLVLDDLERITGRVGGVGDVSQMIKVGYKAATARRVVADAAGGVRTVDLFGPRVVTNIGGADEVLASRMLLVRTARAPQPSLAALTGPDPERSRQLRDELHTFMFAHAGQVAEAFSDTSVDRGVRDRSSEILMPLVAVAEVAGGDWRARLERAVARGSSRPPDAATVLRRALAAILRNGGGPRVSIAQVALQCALEAGPAGCPELLDGPEALGRQLAATGARDGSAPATKARLHGRVTRIYRLSDAFVSEFRAAEEGEAKNISEPQVFDFCTEMACVACPYDTVCDSAVPSLRAAKLARSGRSRT